MPAKECVISYKAKVREGGLLREQVWYCNAWVESDLADDSRVVLWNGPHPEPGERGLSIAKKDIVSLVYS